MSVREELKKFYGDRALFYIKFTRQEEWAKDIINGNLFMNKIEYYRKLESNSGIKGQGDIEELKLTMNPIELTLVHNESGISIPIDSTELKIEYNGDKDKPVFCITGLTIDDMIIESYEENLVKLKFPYKEEDIYSLKNEFGEYAIILWAQDFETKINEALECGTIDWIFDKVKYVHKNSLEKVRSYTSQNGERFLYKDLEFSHQKEYRLVLDENIEDTKILPVGKFENIGIKKIDDLLNVDIILRFYDK